MKVGPHKLIWGSEAGLAGSPKPYLDAVIVEGRTQGTHTGEFNGIPPTGRRMDLRAAVFYRFDGDRMLIETVYFDWRR